MDHESKPKWKAGIWLGKALYNTDSQALSSWTTCTSNSKIKKASGLRPCDKEVHDHKQLLVLKYYWAVKIWRMKNRSIHISGNIKKYLWIYRWTNTHNKTFSSVLCAKVQPSCHLEFGFQMWQLHRQYIPHKRTVKRVPSDQWQLYQWGFILCIHIMAITSALIKMNYIDFLIIGSRYMKNQYISCDEIPMARMMIYI